MVNYQSDQSEQKRDLKEIADRVQIMTEEKKTRLLNLQQELQKIKYQASEQQLE